MRPADGGDNHILGRPEIGHAVVAKMAEKCKLKAGWFMSIINNASNFCPDSGLTVARQAGCLMKLSMAAKRLKN
jgi:hypothetical protein